jgi:hypothetical protein
MAEAKAARLELSFHGGPGVDADQIDRETRQLRSELRDLGLGTVEPRTGEAPPGTKSADGFVLGSLLVEVLPSTISSLIEFLRSWSLRREGRTVKVKTVLADRSVEMEFDPTTVSPTEVKSLVSSIVKELERAGG